MWYDFRMAQVTQEQIQAVADKIAKEFQPEKIILFGSYAWGTPSEDSDVDLCVIKDVENTRDLARKIDRLTDPRPFPLDIIVFKPKRELKRLSMGDTFYRQIITEGEILYEYR